MHKKISKKLMYGLALLSLATIISCTEEIIYIGNTGTLSGTVIAINRQNLTPTNAPSTVTLSQKGKAIKSTETDSTDYFHFENISTGIYELTVSRDSFASRTLQNYQFIGGDINQVGVYIDLAELIYIDFGTLTMDTSTQSPVIIAPILKAKSYNSVRLFFDNQPDITPYNYKTTYVAQFYAYEFYSDKTMKFHIENRKASFEPKYEFKSGETVYCKMYPSVYSSPTNQRYTVDKITGMKVYPVNEDQGTNTISFVWP